MFGSLRYNIGTARNSNGPVPFACIKRKQGNFKPEIPFQNNTGLPWTASQKRHSTNAFPSGQSSTFNAKNALLYNINGRNVQRKNVVNNADTPSLRAPWLNAPYTNTRPEQHELCRTTMRNRHSEQTILLCLFISQM